MPRNRSPSPIPPQLTPSQIRAIRLKAGWSSRQAGRILGTGENSFSDYENGKRTPSQLLRAILWALALRPSLGDAFASGSFDLPAEPTSTASGASVYSKLARLSGM